MVKRLIMKVFAERYLIAVPSLGSHLCASVIRTSVLCNAAVAPLHVYIAMFS
jgi:hypothetical protein